MRSALTEWGLPSQNEVWPQTFKYVLIRQKKCKKLNNIFCCKNGNTYFLSQNSELRVMRPKFSTNCILKPQLFFNLKFDFWNLLLVQFSSMVHYTDFTLLLPLLLLQPTISWVGRRSRGQGPGREGGIFGCSVIKLVFEVKQSKVN